MCLFCFNRFRAEDPPWEGPELAFLHEPGALAFHRTLPGYAPTPLIDLPGVAGELGIGRLFVKDESRRFGLKAFKALGASYAIHRWIERSSGRGAHRGHGQAERSCAFCAATDGNHGRAVAWTARRLGQRSVIYMPSDSARARIEAIRGEGADVVLVEGSFDDCVRRCAADAEASGMQAVSDTAYPGYVDIPRWILLGYQSLFREMEDSLHPCERPEVDFVFLQAGVGGLAAAGAAYYVGRYRGLRPRLVCVEPVEAACCLESAERGERSPARGNQRTIMAGLSCGEVSPVAWPILRDAVDLFLAVGDSYAEDAMRRFAREGVISGESGCAGLAALLAVRLSPGLRGVADRLGLGSESRVLLLNTEGDTDPVGYRRVVGHVASPVSSGGRP